MPAPEDADNELNELRRRLGAELRRVRVQAGKTTREMGGFSSTHVSLGENGKASVSEDFIAEYVRIGGDRVRLLSMLDDVKRASDQERRRKRQKESTQAATIDPRTLTPDSDFHELRRLYQSEELDDHYLIGPNKAVLRATHIVRVRPLTPYSRYYVCSYGSAERGSKGVLTLQPGQGCELARLTETEKGTLHFVLDFNPTGGDVTNLCEFTFAIDFHADEPMIRKPILRNSTRSGIRRVVKRVQFTEPALPSRIWWFQDIELLETEDEPRPGRILPLNPSNFYFRDFTDLVDEYVGLGWDWQ